MVRVEWQKWTETARTYVMSDGPTAEQGSICYRRSSSLYCQL